MAAIAICTAITALAPACVRHSVRSAIFPGCDVSFSSVALPSHGKLVHYSAADSTKLQGAWFRSERRHACTIVFFHGNGESAAQNVGLANDLTSLGNDVFLAEYRGYGGLAGDPSEAHLYEDAIASLKALTREGLDPTRLVLVGRSLGTGVAAELATRGHGRALVLVSPYTSIVAMGERVGGSLAPLVIVDRFDTESKVGSLSIPITVIHGSNDDFIPFAMGQRVAAAAHGRLVRVDGGTHTDLPNLARLITEAIPKC